LMNILMKRPLHYCVDSLIEVGCWGSWGVSKLFDQKKFDESLDALKSLTRRVRATRTERCITESEEKELTRVLDRWRRAIEERDEREEMLASEDFRGRVIETVISLVRRRK